MVKRQSAVDFFQEEIIKIVNGDSKLSEIEIYNQAKEMEKHQIMNAIGVGSYFDPVFPDKYHYRAEDHYTLTYGE